MKPLNKLQQTMDIILLKVIFLGPNKTGIMLMIFFDIKYC